MLLVRRGGVGAVVGREGMAICSRPCSPVVAAMRELRDLLPGGGRGRVGGVISCSLILKWVWLRLVPLYYWCTDCPRV